MGLSRRERKATFVAAGVGIVLLLGVLAILAYRNVVRVRVREEQERAERIRQERESRVVPAIEGATIPLRGGLPLLGSDGVDDDGYTTAYVDQIALRSLLSKGRYGELSGYFDKFQTVFEADAKREMWPLDAADAFASAEDALDAPLDAWVAAMPDSFAPYLARGAHRAAVGFARRGAKWAKNTPDADVRAMKSSLDRAREDLDRAIALRPKLVAAMRYRLQSAAHGSSSATETKASILEQALVACPDCYQIRVTFLMNSTPRWGGSYGAMSEFAKGAMVSSSNPRMRLLAAYVDLDKANLARIDKRFDAAFVAIQRAATFGENADVLVERSRIQRERRQFGLARTDADRALSLRPNFVDAKFERASVNLASSWWEAAGRDLLAGLRVDPTDALGRALLDPVVRGLVYQGQVDEQAGRTNDALRVLDLAAELAPQDSKLQSRRAWLLARTGAKGLADGSNDVPDDIEAVRGMDYALAKEGKYDRVIALWDRYLEKHPDAARAYLERGGAHFQAGHQERANADARRACELGLNEGCLRARQTAR